MIQHSLFSTPWTLRIIAILPVFLAFAVPSGASVRVEGHLPKISQEGRFDFELEVLNSKALSPDGQPQVIQTIHKVKVTVVRGRFHFDLNTGLESYSMDDIRITAKVRRFETGNPFKPAVISRVYALGSGASPGRVSQAFPPADRELHALK